MTDAASAASAASSGRRSRLLVLALYLATMAGIAWALLAARQQVIADWDRPDKRETWQHESQELAGEAGPVERRANKAPEPPHLILLRDHFPAVSIVCLLCGSMLFGFLALTIRGSLRRANADDHAD